MDNIFSSQRTTNVLLIILVAAMLIFAVRLETRFSKIQRGLNYIGDNTSEMSSSLSQIKDDTKYIEIYTEETVNLLER